MAECSEAQSVESNTFDFLETCGLSLEFLRRGCTYTPKTVRWAGDLVVTSEATLHQSVMRWENGSGECEAEHTFPPASDSCGEKTVHPDDLEDVSGSAISEGGKNEFLWTVDEGQPGWDVDIAATNDEGCGGSMAPSDGGDVLFNFEAHTQIKSLCGTVAVNSLGEPKAFYLDNRRSYSDDPDRGLLVAIQNGLTGNWKVLYADALTQLNSGLIDAEDISAAFLDALTEKGISKQDVFSLGMI